MKFEHHAATDFTIESVRCNFDSTEGKRIMIKSHPANNPQNFGYDYLVEIILASDSLKTVIIQELLKLPTDSSLCCVPVRNYGFPKKPPPVSVSYPVSIDALYSINFIAFGVEARKLSPYPVLYDLQTGKEINDNPIEIEAVIEIYRRWFATASKNRFTNFTFPLAGSKYKWYGGISDSSIVFKELPIHPKVDNLGRVLNVPAEYQK